MPGTSPKKRRLSQRGQYIDTFLVSELKKLSRNLEGKGSTLPLFDDIDDLPTELQTKNIFGRVVAVGPDKLSLRCGSAVNPYGEDMGLVQANHPAPTLRLLYYFEMYVKNAGAEGCMTIGLANFSKHLRNSTILSSQARKSLTFGYHGKGTFSRGRKSESFGFPHTFFDTVDEISESFGPAYTTGDTVGVGINYLKNQVFFTKNGVIVGALSKDGFWSLFPTVCVLSQNEEVTVNFGKDPFVFDVEAYEEDERDKDKSKFDGILIPPDACHRIVQHYIQHFGYEDTLNALKLASFPLVPSLGVTEDFSLFALHDRRNIVQLLRAGKIDETLRSLFQLYPHLVEEESSTLCFLLNLQKFIELVQQGRLEDAAVHARSKFEKYGNLALVNDLVEDYASLLVCEEPCKSRGEYLLSQSQRNLVASC